MEKLINIVVDSIPENATTEIIILFLLFASFLYALSQANIIYDFINKFNQRELSRLKELITDENISEKAKVTLKNKLELIAYQKVTGIKINDIYLQEQVIQYYKLAKGRLRYSDFQKATSFLLIDKKDILRIRQPYWYEKIAHVYWVASSIFVFLVLSLFLTALIFLPMPTRIQMAVLTLIIGFGAMLFSLSYQASMLPAVKRIKNEIDKNPFIFHRNETLVKLRQTIFENEQSQLDIDSTPENHEKKSSKTSAVVFHPLAYLSKEERQDRIKQVLGAWQSDSEIDDIFVEIDRVRHQEHGRQINSLDD